MFSKPLIQFSVDGWSGVPSLLFTWNQTKMEVMKIMVTSFKDPMHILLHSLPPTLQQAPTNPRLRWRLLDATGQVWVSLFWVTAPSSWVLVHTSFCLCPPRVYLPVLCKFWQLYDGVNVDLIQEGLCNTQVCCTQSPCPCSSPLLTCTSTEDVPTQFCLSQSLWGLWVLVHTRFV